MAKMWEGRTDGITDALADCFNSSISFDKRLYDADIKGSIAHADMLAKCGIITNAEADSIKKGLAEILCDLASGKLEFDMSAEDVHMFVEKELTERIGDVGKKLHTARSRNDQVALDIRLYLRCEIADICEKLEALIGALADKAGENAAVIMPGYTHLQRAQPITFGHCLCAYCMMLLRDISRLADCKKRMNVCPIGSCALAGTTYGTDRFYEAAMLGFDAPCENSLDGVSDRDFAVELSADIAVIMMHLSRLAEETILWSSSEFGFIELSDAYTTGSSIMPQKKNSDMAELVRGKTGRVYGDLTSLLVTMKGLPLAYNKDMQEDKECIFDACDTVKMCIDVFTGMIRTLKVNAQRMKSAASGGFINATDLADYLVTRGMAFRDAYKISGKLVAYCIKEGKVLETLTLDEYRAFSDIIDEGVFDAVDLNNCVLRRKSYGGTSPESVHRQVEYIRSHLK